MIADFESKGQYIMENPYVDWDNITPISGYEFYPVDFITKLCRGEFDRGSNGEFDVEICKKRLKKYKTDFNDIINEICNKWLNKMDNAISTWVINYNIIRYQAIIEGYSGKDYVDTLASISKQIDIPIIDDEGYRIPFEIFGCQKAVKILQETCGYDIDFVHNRLDEGFVRITMKV